MNKKLEFSVFLIIILVTFFLRTYNVNWDSGTHIHPDERFLTMVVNDMRVPQTLSDYLNPQISTMNPHNINYGFFVYGTFPLYLVKILSIFLKMDNYNNITILGRIVSAFFDTGVVIILFFLSKLLFSLVIPAKAGILKTSSSTKEKQDSSRSLPRIKLRGGNDKIEWAPLLPPFLYSIMVLPIQLSHFFATDTFLAFFMIASFCIAVLIHRNIFEKKSWRSIYCLSIMLGITIGLGLASKITMVFIIPLDILIILSSLVIPAKAGILKSDNNIAQDSNMRWNDKITKRFICIFVYSCIPVFIFSYLIFRLTMPMAFTDANFLNFSLNPQWVKNLTDLQAMSSNSLSNTFPPSIQWFTTQPLLFPLKNMILWGMGIPLAIICIIALILNLKFLIYKIIKEKTLTPLISPIFLITFFTLAFFLYEGSQFVKPMRYIYPIYWCFALISGYFVEKIIQRFHIKLLSLITLLSLIALLAYPAAFLQIYSRPHTRVEASRWMFNNLPAGSKVTFEEWDDPLPFLIDGHVNEFPGTPLPMFWPDTSEKWDKIASTISQTDYIILSSNRVYGSIVRRPDLYPQTAKYYDLLFDDKLGFKKIADFTSRPTIPFLNYELIDDAADETFTVYDHPRVMIFRNVKRLTKEELTQKIYQ